MESRKLDLIQFRNIKKQLIEIINKIDFVSKEEQYSLFNKYKKIFYSLISFDLSDIPFEEWKGLEIITGEKINFSKSHANLDFALLEAGSINNYHGCKVKNIHMLDKYFDESSFDQEYLLNTTIPTLIRYKYYLNKLTINDLINLSNQQLEYLIKNDLDNHLIDGSNLSILFKILGYQKTIELYRYNEEDFNIVKYLLNYDYDSYYPTIFATYTDELKKALYTKQVSEIKDTCYIFLRKNYIYDHNLHLDKLKIPSDFIKMNSDLFLTEVEDKYLIEKFNNKELSFKDVLENFEILHTKHISSFMKNCRERVIINKIGVVNFFQLYLEHRDLYNYLLEKGIMDLFIDEVNDDYLLEERMYIAVRKICNKYDTINSQELLEVAGVLTSDDQDIPLSDILNRRENIRSNILENMLLYLRTEYLKDFYQLLVYEGLNDQDIRDIFLVFNDCLNRQNNFQEYNYMDKNKFYKHMITLFNIAKKNQLLKNIKLEHISMLGDVLGRYHKDSFIDLNADEDLQRKFYDSDISIEMIKEHPEWIKYLKQTDILDNIKGHYTLYIKKNHATNIFKYIKRNYGIDTCFQYIVEFGPLLSCLHNSKVIFYDNMPIEEFNDLLCKMIVNELNDTNLYGALYKNVTYLGQITDYLDNNDMIKNRYPEFYIDIDNDYLKFMCLSGMLEFKHIKDNPDLYYLLQGKNIKYFFHYYIKNEYKETHISKSILDIIDYYGEKVFLSLALRYGNLLNNLLLEIDIFEKKLSEEELEEKIEYGITLKAENGRLYYNDTDEFMFLKRRSPKLFLDSSAPEELKNCFYCDEVNDLEYPFNFDEIAEHPEWIPFLKDKNIYAAIIRTLNSKNISNFYNDEFSVGDYHNIRDYFKLFGNAALLLIVKKQKAVEYMIRMGKLDTLKLWYDSTGKKYIPDAVVMNLIPTNQIDKFLSKGRKWSNIMKRKTLKKNIDFQSSVLKLAYVFGVFDDDERGYKLLCDLLFSIPNILNDDDTISLLDLNETNNEIKEQLIREGFTYNYNLSFWEQVYKRREDGKLELTFNQQLFPKSTMLIRDALDKYVDCDLLTPDKLLQMCGSFSLVYDKDFREFLLSNLKQIINEPVYLNAIANIQKQFKEIKILNKNRKLTLEHAYNFIVCNRFNNLELGNEELGKLVSAVGYTQNEFDILQQIYDEGKRRVKSTIPRIKTKIDGLRGEITSLDDPIPLTIGPLSDSCQKINDNAEVSMEHSMTEGRLFIVFDEDDSILAQSWVWRRKNTLCFDNIEVPEKQFNKYKYLPNGEIERKKLADRILKVYEDVAKKMVEEDQKKFKAMLQNNLITKEEYDSLKLTEVTVGLGFNDIAASIEDNLDMKMGYRITPIDYKSHYFKNSQLYLKDSRNQYILYQDGESKSTDEEVKPIYEDTIDIIDINSFTKEHFLMYRRFVSYNHLKVLEDINLDQEDLYQLVASDYNVDKNILKMVVKPTFILLFVENGDDIYILDLLISNNSLDYPTIIYKLNQFNEQMNKNVVLDNLNPDKRIIFEDALLLERNNSYGR